MPRPQSKQDLLDLGEGNYVALTAIIGSMSPERREAAFAFEDRDRNVRDVLVHLHEWHVLPLDWVAANTSGPATPFLPQGYTWSSFAPLNVLLRDKHASTTLQEAQSLLEESLSDQELFTKRHFPWTGTTSLGAYCVSGTSSHYDWAIKKIRKHARG
jgi:hypothetical protein